MAVLDKLEPREVFHFFEEMCAIPHGTFDTKRISDYCVAFAKERGLSVTSDSANNVIIKKPGTAGYEDSEPVIIQGHLDMVCEKTPDSLHDFDKDPLDLYVEDGYVKARDTTLGGDDGIAVAMAMALLDSSDIPHPPIEAVFTTDEEVGMGGAMEIDLSGLEGKKLINIDSEEEGILTAGCAGGYRYTATLPVHREKKTGTLSVIRIHGLQGGHSGIEIDKQRGNAHKMMGRLLNSMGSEIALDLVEIKGGSKDNVISMDTVAEILTSPGDSKRVSEMARQMKETWDAEFMGDEPGLTVDVEASDSVTVDACDRGSTDRVIAFLVICPYGVQEFSRKLAGLVETSINVGIIETAVDYVTVSCSVRSSVESKKRQMCEQLEKCVALVGGSGQIYNDYPAWQFDPDSKLRRIMVDTYKDLFGEEPQVTTIHAGLECGLFLGKKGDLDCVSIGPNLFDVHSFKERLEIASTERTWKYLKSILANCK